MESYKRGWAFLKQSWQMVLKDKDLIKPSIYTMIAGFIVTLILVIPIGFVSFLLQNNPIGKSIIYILWAILIFIHYILVYIFSAMTVYLIFGYLAEGDGRMDKTWMIVKRDVWGITSLAAATTAVNLFSSAMRGRGRSGGRSLLAGFIETVWTEAAFLILPAMVIENINIKDGIKRATQIIKDNLLLAGISTVEVKSIVGLVSFILGAVGVGIGLSVGAGIVTLSRSSTPGIIIGVILGILIATPFILFATVTRTYTGTAYPTCLYLWARDVERAHQAGEIGVVPAPTPLAAAFK